jgi:hypothetical protein
MSQIPEVHRTFHGDSEGKSRGKLREDLETRKKRLREIAKRKRKPRKLKFIKGKYRPQ